MDMAWQDRRLHVRLFLWAEPVVAKFFDTRSRTRNSDQVRTNLCPYMRTMLLWLPLAIITNIATFCAVVATVTLIPGTLFGWGGYLMTLLVIGFFVGLIVLFNMFAPRVQRGVLRLPKADPTPGFGTALRTYARKAHDGICPGIVITRTRRKP